MGAFRPMSSAQLVAERYGYPKEYQDYDTQYQGKKEAVGYTFWDVNAYTSAATTFISAFTTVKASKNLSNMTLAGQLPSTNGFFVRALRVAAYVSPFSETLIVAPAIQTGLADDLARLLTQGVLTFKVGHKVYGEWPLWMLPAGGGIVPTLATAQANVTDFTNNGLPDPRAVYTLSVPIFMSSQINFAAELSWPGGAVTIVNSPMNIWVGMDGDLIRGI
jgi:hypothetical protein